MMFRILLNFAIIILNLLGIIIAIVLYITQKEDFYLSLIPFMVILIVIKIFRINKLIKI